MAAKKKTLIAGVGGGVAALVLGAGGLALAFPAHAATMAPSGTSSPSATDSDVETNDGPDAGDQETPVTGTDATTAQAAAIQAVGDGIAGDVTADDGSGYEVVVTKSDGSTVEVHLDASFSVTKQDVADAATDGESADDPGIEDGADDGETADDAPTSTPTN